MFVVFDLDGTLSDAVHRLFLLDKDPPDYDEFYQRAMLDDPILPMCNTYRALYQSGADIEIWTGRSDIVRSETEIWLQMNGLQPHTLKRMREHGHHGSDVELKRNWLWEHLAMGRPKPDLIFEDRARVVNMWREEGIRCAQVDKGEF